MKLWLATLLLLPFSLAFGQAPELKFIADTLVVQADGTNEADPDLATMTFRIFSQEKELKKPTMLPLSLWDALPRSRPTTD